MSRLDTFLLHFIGWTLALAMLLLFVTVLLALLGVVPWEAS